MSEKKIGNVINKKCEEKFVGSANGLKKFIFRTRSFFGWCSPEVTSLTREDH